jgi:glycosyltransferase involved in cell wall biosynthesis
MKISIICFGKFHAFDLARELKANSSIVSLYSSYPYFISKKYNIKFSEHYSFFFLQVIDRLTFRKISSFLKFIFAKTLTFLIRSDQDFIILWSDTPNFLIKFLKRNYKSILILERGSAHIKFQNRLLKEEYKKINSGFSISNKVILNEIENYDDSDYISIPSKFVMDSFLKYNVPREKLIINSYGADLAKFYKIKTKSNQKFTFLTCGHASVQKGFHKVLNSHKHIKEDFIHIHVGTVESIFKDKLKNYKNLIVYQSVNQIELVRYYNMADVFILPSIQDGFGMVLLESMACGTPIIASKFTGATSINSSKIFGHILTINNSGEISKTINHLIRNPDKLNIMSENCQKIITEGGYSWDDYGKRYTQNIIKFIKKHSEKI